MDILLIAVLPFAYGALTRVPFVFAGVHVLTVFDGDLGAVSFALGAYQVSRVLGNCLVVLLGERRSLLFGSACGLLGYCSLAATAAADATGASSGGISDGHTSLQRFVASLALVGLSEQVTALQALLKVRCAALDEGAARSRLLLQYACNVCGTSVAFLASGIAYSAGGLRAAAQVGAAFAAMLFAGSAVMLAIEQSCDAQVPPAAGEGPREKETDQIHLLGHAGAWVACDVLQTSRRASLTGVSQSQMTMAFSGSLNSWASAAVTDSAVIQSYEEECLSGKDSWVAASVPPLYRVRSGFQALAADSSQANALMAAVKAVPPQKLHNVPLEPLAGCNPSWISYVIAVTFCLQALLIGSVLSVAPLIVTHTLGLGVKHVGLAFGTGEAVGSAALLISCSPRGRAYLRRALPTPLGLLGALAALGASALLLAHGSQSPEAALALLVIIMGLNDVGTSMSGECIANTLPADWYLRINTLSNVLRRCGNTVTCVIGPLMYGAAPWLPFSLFGAFTVVWAMTLAVLFARRSRELAQHTEASPASKLPSERRALFVSETAARAASVLVHLRRFADKSFVSSERNHHLRLQKAAAAAVATTTDAVGGENCEAVGAAAGAVSRHASWSGSLKQRIGVVSSN